MQTKNLEPIAISTLLVASVEELGRYTIAELNLACAEGLSSSSEFGFTNELRMFEVMAQTVRSETERHLYRFKQNPADFEHSEGIFRMVMMGVVLGEDFKIAYAPSKISASTQAHMGDGFFADSRDVLLHGLLGPSRQGTCSSLPVLYVAIGRKLGYPLKLVTTKGHLFVRWEDTDERFNIEVTGKGVNKFPDEYYRHWPMEVIDEEIQSQGYLKSLSTAEEFAVFLSIRGMCWLESGHVSEAAESFRAATRLAPGCQSYRTMLERLQSGAQGQSASNERKGKLR